MMVVVVGIDVHKATHTAVAVDMVGRQIASKTVRATDAGHRQLLAWVRQQWPDGEVRYAVEDCRVVSARLERALLAAGQPVVRVPPHLMAASRASVRAPGKSDPIDALAIARVVLREPNLPTACHTGVSRDLKLLVDHRDSLVRHRTGLQNRLRWHLHELDPEIYIPEGGLDRKVTLDKLCQWLAEQPASMVVRLATELLDDIRALTGRVNALERELAAMTRTLAPQLLALTGCGVLTTAKLLGETANISRFRSEACFAMHAGAAPIPASSGNTTRHRLARGGNRQLNACLHRIAITQIRHPGPGSVYYQRRRANGDTSMEAIRALKRRLARVVYNLLKQQPLT